jgi:hypothetical protein
MTAQPQKVHEVIWAYAEDVMTGRGTWSEAVITSRGGSYARRITVKWEGLSFQCSDHGRDNFDLGRFNLNSAFGKHYQVGGRARSVAFWRDRKRGEAWNRMMHEMQRRAAAPFLARYASASDWAMLDLQPGATEAEIEKAFRAKALKAHPDQGGDAAIFRALKMAREACLAEAQG